MKEDFLGIRSDLYLEKNYKDFSLNCDIKVFKEVENNISYNTIYFSNLNNVNLIKEKLNKELSFFINKVVVKKNFHVLVIGLGNENHTADSVGPKTLKHLKINSYLTNLGIDINNNKISSLEPGVLGQTGIATRRIVESVTKEIKPDLVILIDSYVSEKMDYLNKTIQISDGGISPGGGLNGINFEISKKTLNIPTIAIGIPTAIEIEIDKHFYILSTKDIDDYVNKISEIIGESLNEVLFN